MKMKTPAIPDVSFPLYPPGKVWSWYAIPNKTRKIPIMRPKALLLIKKYFKHWNFRPMLVAILSGFKRLLSMTPLMSDWLDWWTMSRSPFYRPQLCRDHLKDGFDCEELMWMKGWRSFNRTFRTDEVMGMSIKMWILLESKRSIRFNFSPPLSLSSLTNTHCCMRELCRASRILSQALFLTSPFLSRSQLFSVLLVSEFCGARGGGRRTKWRLVLSLSLSLER